MILVRYCRTRATCAALVMATAVSSCGGGSARSASEPLAVPPPPSVQSIPSGPSRATTVLLREPRGDARCPNEFPRFYERDPGEADADPTALYRAIGLAPDEASAVPSASGEAAAARGDRCFAAGPHRGLNLSNWCCRAGPEARDVPPPDDALGLVATLSTDNTDVIDAGDLTVAVAVVNRGPEPAELNLFVAEIPMLFIEVRDATGAPVPTVPPVTPPQSMETLSLPPHGGRTFRHRLAMFDPPLPPGDYTARVRDPAIASGALRFRIVPRAGAAAFDHAERHGEEEVTLVGSGGRRGG